LGEDPNDGVRIHLCGVATSDDRGSVPAEVETAQANSARRVFSRGHRPQLKILPKLNSQISQKFGSSLSYRQVGEEPLVIKQMPGSITSVFSEAALSG
jgi:hypothetical protein